MSDAVARLTWTLCGQTFRHTTSTPRSSTLVCKVATDDEAALCEKEASTATGRGDYGVPHAACVRSRGAAVSALRGGV